MDLEVDHRARDAAQGEGKITAFTENDQHFRSELIAPDHEGTSKPFLPYMPVEQRRSSKLGLLIAFALGLALAAIAAGVAGSIAVSRQNSLNSCLKAKDVLTGSSSSSCAGAPSSNSSDKTNGTAVSIHDIKPTSECKNLTSPYSSPLSSSFTLECGTDLIENVPDLVGVYVYTFTDCVNACAIYNDPESGGHGNSTCYAVSYNFALPKEQGNCWLKGKEKIPFHSNETVDSAIFALS